MGWTALREGASDRGDQGFDNFYGHGIINVWGAMDYIEQLECRSRTPVPTVGPPTPAPTPGPPAVPVCPGGCSLLVTVVTDGWPNEITWSLKNPDGAETLTNTTNMESEQAYYSDFCLYNGNWTFTIRDSYGDGISPP